MIKTDTKLYSYSAFYHTPSGRKTYVIGVKRGRVEGLDIDRVATGKITRDEMLIQDVTRNIRVDLCMDPRRCVEKGVGGITITRLETIEE